MFNPNNYGYNPYGTYIPQRQFQQPVQQPIEQSPVMGGQRPVLTGKQVDSIDVVKAMDIPMDGTVSYFPLADGSAIVTKQLQMDGTSKITIFKQHTEDTKETVKYLVSDDLDDLKEDIKELRQEIKEIKKSKKKDD